MSEEIQKQEVPTTPTPASEEKVETPSVDYKAELEALQKSNQDKDVRLAKAEHTITRLKKKAPAETYDDDEPLPREKVEAVVAERIAGVRSELLQDVFTEELSNASDNPDERQLIDYHYRNTIKPSGTNRAAIKADIERARILANAPRILKENRELAETAKAGATKSNSGFGTNMDRPAPTSIDYTKVFSKTDLEFMTKRGWSEDMKKKAAADLLAKGGK